MRAPCTTNWPTPPAPSTSAEKPGSGRADHVLRERAGRRAAVDRLALQREPGVAAEQRAAPDRRRERPARRGAPAPAGTALAAGGCPREHDAIALFFF